MSSQRENALDAALVDLYSVFARYPLPADTRPCPCGCKKKEDVRRLSSKPLRLLQPADMAVYAFSAMNTWGDSIVLRHFLPRLLEIISNENERQALSVDVEIVLGKPGAADWRLWPLKEQEAIRVFFHALWALRRVQPLDQYDEYHEPCEEWICGIARSEATLRPYLNAWLLDPDLNARRSLVALILRSGVISSKNCDPFWDLAPNQLAEFRAWLFSKTTREHLEHAAAESIPDADKALFILASHQAPATVTLLD